MCKENKGCVIDDVVIGESALIQLSDGRVLRTSPVRHFITNPDGSVRIVTQNSEYKVAEA